MSYPLPLLKCIHSGVMVFSTRDQAAAAYQRIHGQPLPPWDSQRPYQPFMETRPKPGDSDESGYEYNFVAPDRHGFWRMETDGIPWSEVSVPNMPGPNDPPVKPGSVNNIPLRKLGSTGMGDHGLEVIASSPFGVAIVSSKELDSIGLLMVPPDVLDEIANGTYVAPGVD